MNDVSRSFRGNSNASRDIAHHLHPYTNFKKHEQTGPLTIVRGRGVYVMDDDGKEYIEGMAGLWSAALGFSNERLATVAYEQMKQLPFYHAFNNRSHEPAINLAEKLKSMAPVPMSKVFFANSGSEANDTVVKMVWYMNNSLGRPKKKKIVGRLKGYHGITVAAGSLTGLPVNHRSFDLPIQGIVHTSCPHFYRFGKDGETEEQFATRCAQELEELIVKEGGADEVAAMIAEPVMGAGGVIVPPMRPGFASTKATPSAVVMCSSTTFRPGRRSTRGASTVSTKTRSRSKMSTPRVVTSPCTSSGKPSAAMRSSTGRTASTRLTPLSELVVAPAG